MDYMWRHWRGELSVGRAGWLSSLVGILICTPLDLLNTYCFFAANHIRSYGDIIMRVQSGQLDFVPAPWLLHGLEQCVDVTVLVWWSVGTWRSCLNDVDERGRPLPHGNAKTGIIATVFLSLLIVFFGI